MLSIMAWMCTSSISRQLCPASNMDSVMTIWAINLNISLSTQMKGKERRQSCTRPITTPIMKLQLSSTRTKGWSWSARNS